MTEPAESGIDWDETVDVLCVGTSPGVLAYGLLCAAADLEVLVVESGELDPQTAQWRSLMTEDLDGGESTGELPLVHAEPVACERITDRTKLETFVGEELRHWSACCLASPFGVMFTEVPDLDPMRTSDGRSVRAGVVGSYRFGAGPAGAELSHWLREQADDLMGPADDRLDGLLIEYGRIAGVTLRTSDGPRLIGVAKGLAVAVGAVPDGWAEQPELHGKTVDVAVVSRTAGRFARVELLDR